MTGNSSRFARRRGLNGHYSIYVGTDRLDFARRFGGGLDWRPGERAGIFCAVWSLHGGSVAGEVLPPVQRRMALLLEPGVATLANLYSALASDLVDLCGFAPPGDR